MKKSFFLLPSLLLCLVLFSGCKKDDEPEGLKSPVMFPCTSLGCTPYDVNIYHGTAPIERSYNSLNSVYRFYAYGSSSVTYYTNCYLYYFVDNSLVVSAAVYSILYEADILKYLNSLSGYSRVTTNNGVVGFLPVSGNGPMIVFEVKYTSVYPNGICYLSFVEDYDTVLRIDNLGGSWVLF